MAVETGSEILCSFMKTQAPVPTYGSVPRHGPRVICNANSGLTCQQPYQDRLLYPEPLHVHHSLQSSSWSEVPNPVTVCPSHTSIPSDPDPHRGHVKIHQQLLILLNDILGQLRSHVSDRLIVLLVVAVLESSPECL